MATVKWKTSWMAEFWPFRCFNVLWAIHFKLIFYVKCVCQALFKHLKLNENLVRWNTPVRKSIHRILLTVSFAMLEQCSGLFVTFGKYLFTFTHQYGWKMVASFESWPLRIINQNIRSPSMVRWRPLNRMHACTCYGNLCERNMGALECSAPIWINITQLLHVCQLEIQHTTNGVWTTKPSDKLIQKLLQCCISPHWIPFIADGHRDGGSEKGERQPTEYHSDADRFDAATHIKGFISLHNATCI